MSFFGKHQAIAGLAISEETVGLLLFKQKVKYEPAYKKEQELPEEAIHDGKIQNKDSFIKALRGVVPPRIFHTWREPRKVIISLPESIAQYTSFLVPKTLSSKRLEDAICENLERASHLPIDEIYYDFEEYPCSEKQKLIFVASAMKENINAYLELIQKVGLYPIAVESEFLSLRHAIPFRREKRVRILIFLGRKKLQLIITKDAIVLFSRSAPWQGDEKTLKKEVIRMIEYYFTEYPQGPAIKELVLVSAEKQDGFVEPLKQGIGNSFKIGVTSLRSPSSKINNVFLLGAAIRGQVMRRKDKFISLMVPGTEELFHEAQILLISKIVNDFLIIISVILVIIFSLTSFYILPTFEKQKEDQIIRKQAQPPIKEIEELEKKISEFNSNVEPLAEIETSAPDWKTAFFDITLRIREGIHIKRIGAALNSNTISISGNSDDIGSLLDFKSSLSFSGIYTGDFTIPFSSFEKGSDIPFNYNLTFRDKSILFPFKFLSAKVTPSPTNLNSPL